MSRKIGETGKNNTKGVKGEQLKELHGQQCQMPQKVPGGRNEKQHSNLTLRTPFFAIRTIPLCVLIHVNLQHLERKGDEVKTANSKKKDKCDRSFKRHKIKRKEYELQQLRGFQVTKQELRFQKMVEMNSDKNLPAFPNSFSILFPEFSF